MSSQFIYLRRLFSLLTAITVFLFAGCEEENKAPTVELKADFVKGFIPMEVKFTIAATDDGKVTKYSIDYEGDGTFDDSNETGLFTKIFYYVTTYNVVGQATDDKGLSSTSKLVITVQPNAATTIGIYPDIKSGFAPLTVTFTGFTVDSDGEIVKYEYDFDGNGTYDFSGSTPLAVNTYKTAGTYKATIRVTDSKGGPTTKVFDIVVKTPTYIHQGFDKVKFFKGAFFRYKNSLKEDLNSSHTDYTIEVKMTLGDSTMVNVDGSGWVAFYAITGETIPANGNPVLLSYSHVGVKYGEFFYGSNTSSGWKVNLAFSAQTGTIGNVYGISGAFGALSRYPVTYSTVNMPNIFSTQYNTSSVKVSQYLDIPQCERVGNELFCNDETHTYQITEYYLPGVGFGGYTRKGSSRFYGSGGGTLTSDLHYFLVDTNVVK